MHTAVRERPSGISPCSISARRSSGANVLYRESPMGHAIDPDFLRELAAWLPV